MNTHKICSIKAGCPTAGRSWPEEEEVGEAGGQLRPWNGPDDAADTLAWSCRRQVDGGAPTDESPGQAAEGGPALGPQAPGLPLVQHRVHYHSLAPLHCVEKTIPATHGLYTVHLWSLTARSRLSQWCHSRAPPVSPLYLRTWAGIRVNEGTQAHPYWQATRKGVRSCLSTMSAVPPPVSSSSTMSCRLW
jgi:hypothetical protein